MSYVTHVKIQAEILNSLRYSTENHFLILQTVDIGKASLQFQQISCEHEQFCTIRLADLLFHINFDNLSSPLSSKKNGNDKYKSDKMKMMSPSSKLTLSHATS